METASAKEMVKYHIQGLAVVDKPQNIPAERFVVTITVRHDDVDETQLPVIGVYSLDRHQHVSQFTKEIISIVVCVFALDQIHHIEIEHPFHVAQAA